MVRTQIYLTEKERAALKAMARLRGKTQSELIREAIDRYIAAHSQEDRLRLLRSAKGMWSDREDSEFQDLRAGMDREFETGGAR